MESGPKCISSIPVAFFKRPVSPSLAVPLFSLRGVKESDETNSNMAERNIHGLAFAVAYVTFAFGLLTSVFRFYSRAVLVKQWGWDDSFSVLVMVGLWTDGVHLASNSNRSSASPINGFCSYSSTWAAASTSSTCSPCLTLTINHRPELVECSFASLKLLKTAFIQEIVIYGAHCVIKVTFLLFYLRLNQELDFRKWVVLGFVLNGSVFVTNL